MLDTDQDGAASHDSIRALIVEDEPPGYKRLLAILTRQRDVEVVGWARNVATALEAVRIHRPNVLFLDVQMPGATGVQLARSLGEHETPLIVFVTAHEEYAVEAFELEAVDYLLKPYTDERVEEALERIRRSLRRSPPPSATPSAGTAKGLSTQGASQNYLSRLAVESRGKLRVIPVNTIERIRADGVYAEIHSGSGRYLLRESLSALDLKLNPEQFCRIHRSEIVSLDAIESYIKGGGSYVVQLKNGAELPVGRSYRKALEVRLGL